MMNDTFAREYQEMVRALEAIIAEYPAEMRGALRSYAADVLNARLQQMWRERLRERLLREEWELPDTAGEAGAGGAAQ